MEVMNPTVEKVKSHDVSPVKVHSNADTGYCGGFPQRQSPVQPGRSRCLGVVRDIPFIAMVTYHPGQHGDQTGAVRE